MQNLESRISQSAIALLTWFALIGQFMLVIDDRTGSVPSAVFFFFGFFTILTNLLVAIAVTRLLLTPVGMKHYGFFARAGTMTAINVYMIVVFIIYNTILRPLVDLDGMAWIVDELLHLVIPILFFLYWWLFISRTHLQWKVIPSWLWYPLLYCVFLLIRGKSSGFYTYPFMNVDVLGYGKVIFNIALVLLLFLAISFLLVGLMKMRTRATLGAPHR